MKKKKILIVSDSMRTGGIQSSLRAFLEQIPLDKFDVELFLFNHEGLEAAKLDRNIKVTLGGPLLQAVSCTSSYARGKGLLAYMIRKFFALLCKIFYSDTMYNLIFLFQKPIKGIDVAISFSNNVSDRSVYFGYNLFVLNKVKAKRKIAYIHIDYNLIQSKRSDKEYRAFDTILTSSDFVKKSFLKHNPDLASRCRVLYPFLPKGAQPDGAGLSKDYFNIVTVGRLDKNKSQIDCIEVSEKLQNAGIAFRWYIVGDGPEMPAIRARLKSSDARKHIILCGQQKSAGYIKEADLLVSFSKNESYGLSIAEAASMETPIVSLKYPAIFELLPDGYAGICETTDEIAQRIIDICTDEEKYRKLKTQTILKENDEKMVYNIFNE